MTDSAAPAPGDGPAGSASAPGSGPAADREPGGPAYRALALQVRCRAVNALPPDAARAAMLDSIARIRGQLLASIGFLGRDVRLVVLPEYFLTGFPMGDTVPSWAGKAALAPDGPEHTALAETAAAAGVHLAGNAYETDPHFPGLHFQASFVIAPSGEVVLRYRRLHSLFSPTPYDVWSAYLDAYGLDGVLPVADTSLGRVAAIASEEILVPELARALALRGAEVFVHSTSEVGSPLPTPKAIARRARAIENLAYVVSANSAGIDGTAIPAQSTDGMSQVVDPGGLVLAEAGSGESIAANAVLDLRGLRRARRRPGMAKLLARVKPGLWAGEYARADGGAFERPGALDGGQNGMAADRDGFVRRHAAVVQRLVDAGVIA